MADSKREVRKQVDFAIRYQPEVGTPDGILLEYIKDSRIVPSREMVFQALRAFWLPFAYQASGELTQEEELQLVLEAVYALDKHADYLCSYFGMERPDFLAKLQHRQSTNGNKKVTRRRVRGGASLRDTEQQKIEPPPEVKESSYFLDSEYDPDESFPDD